MEIDQATYSKLKKDLYNKETTIKRQHATIKKLKHNSGLEQSQEINKALLNDIKQFLGADKYRNFLIMRGE